MKKTIKKKQRKIVKKRSPFRARGISKIGLVAIVAVVLAGAGGYYVFSQKNGGGASTAIPFVKPPLNPDCKYKDPELCKFMNNFPNQTSYAVTSTGSIAGYTTEATYEISGKDKFHMVSKQNGKESSNMISIGDTTYTLDYTDHKWFKQTIKPDDTQKSTEKEVKDQFSFDTKEIEDKTKYKFIAKEACGDLTCFKYEIENPNSTDAKTFMWFDDRDYLMRKMRIEQKDGAMESLYSYSNISITVPSPVKETPPNSPNNFGGGANPGINEAEVKKMMQQYQQQNESNNTPSDNSEAPVNDNAPEEQ